MLRLSPSFWNDEFRTALEAKAKHKAVFVIRSVKELKEFVKVHAS